VDLNCFSNFVGLKTLEGFKQDAVFDVLDDVVVDVLELLCAFEPLLLVLLIVVTVPDPESSVSLALFFLLLELKLGLTLSDTVISISSLLHPVGCKFIRSHVHWILLNFGSRNSVKLSLFFDLSEFSSFSQLDVSDVHYRSESNQFWDN
jgi:hypothetical protein